METNIGFIGWRSDDTHERELEDRCQKHRCQRIAKTFMLCAAVVHSRSPVSDQMKKQTDPGDFRSRKIVVDGNGRFFVFLVQDSFMSRQQKRPEDDVFKLCLLTIQLLGQSCFLS